MTALQYDTYKEVYPQKCTEYGQITHGNLNTDKVYFCNGEEWTITYGKLEDERDGQIYKTVTIGSQTWMAENLNYKSENSFCYNDSEEYCSKYGRLYIWTAAMTACPSGWHLPTSAEWEALYTEVGGSSIAGKMLKATSGWSRNGNGSDVYLFAALPAGTRTDYGESRGEGSDAFFWSSTENLYREGSDAFSMCIGADNEYECLDGNKEHAFSVRCLKDK